MKLTEQFDELVEDYINSQGWIKPGAKIYDYNRAGEGNMNFVIRVCTNYGNVILKQSRAYVEKYPQIPAPIGRIAIEKAFYEKISKNVLLQSYSPKIIGYDAMFYALALEDLGYGKDFMFVYQEPGNISEKDLFVLVDYLLELHNLEVKEFPENLEMKKLNHEHIFLYPFFEGNEMDLDLIQEGLQSLAEDFKNDIELKEAVTVLGENYLNLGNVLLHGDFYPGSWLKVGDALKVIDPEFAFLGDREFDLGVLLAHLYLADVDKDLILLVKKYYIEHANVDLELLKKYIGVEIIRRLIGLAQLPLALTIDNKREKLLFARNLILTPEKP